jgi:hypothetical protein
MVQEKKEWNLGGSGKIQLKVCVTIVKFKRACLPMIDPLFKE